MNEIVIKDYDRFNDVIVSMKSSLENLKRIFESENKNTELLNDGSTWEGKAAESTYQKIKEINSNYESIEYSLGYYIKFLEKTLEDYKLLDKEIDNNAEKYSQELNINS